MMIKSKHRPPRYTHHFCGSMLPLLQNKDILEIIPVRKVVKGDIVLFKGEEKEQWIAHRVIKIEKKSIYTKGDNNKSIDDKALCFSDISRIVSARWRNGKRLVIYRGRRAILQYYIYLAYTKSRALVRKSIDRFSTPKALSPLLDRLLPAPSEVTFQKNGRQKRELYIGKRYIGSYSEREQCWKIRFPYRLLYK